MDISSKLNQTITYWAPSQNDPTGGRGYSAPVVFTGRWQDKTELFRDTKGEEFASLAIVYGAIEMKAGGYLLLGDAGAVIGDPVSAGALQIRHYRASPSLHASQTLHQAVL